MATLQSTGLGSGLDVNGLVTKLVSAEGTPKQTQITKAQTTVATKISAMGALKGALGGFQNVLGPLKTLEAFNVHAATSADPEIFTATATSAAPVGSYDIEVKNLASAQQLTSEPFANSTATVGSGVLTLSVGTKSFNVNVDGARGTLDGIRDAINKAPDNAGVRAAIVQAADGAHLVLTSSATGAANTIKVVASDTSVGLGKLTYNSPADVVNYKELRQAKDATIVIAGFEKKSATNVVKDAIDGVTLTLLKTTEEDEPVSVNVSENVEAALTRINNFVSQYNALATTVGGLQSYDASTGKAGPLLGDAMLRGIDSDLKSALVKPVAGATGTYTSLASLGITTNKDGTLTVNTDKLKNALQTNFDAVGQVFGSENGVAARLDKAIAPRLAGGGDIALRNQALDKQSKSLTKDLETLDTRMKALEARYLKQFTTLDSLLSSMQSTSTYLTQQLSNLPGAFSG